MDFLVPSPRLEIEGLGKLASIKNAFKTNQEYGKQTRAIMINDEDEDEEDEDAGEDIRPPSPKAERVTRGCESLNGYELHHSRLKRSEAFWKALSRSAPNLKLLSLGFYVHEIDELSMVDIFPADFAKLESLELNLSGGHGDDAVMIDRLLRKTHSLKSLSLYLPSCDLESCRIKGLWYDYDFPGLENLSVSVYDSPGSGLSEFLARHPSVKVLNLSVDGEEPLEIPDSVFPNLQALYVDSCWGRGTPFYNLLSESAARPIAYLNADSFSKSTYCEIAKASATLTCLETRDSLDSWRKEDFPKQMKDLLTQLPNLREIALHLPTGSTSWSNDDETRGGPEPMDVEDLLKLMSCFPSESQIRALRMTDYQGIPLQAELLADFQHAPASLEYVSWQVEGKIVLYHLKKVDEKTEAVEGQPVRTAGQEFAESWTDESVLCHLS